MSAGGVATPADITVQPNYGYWGGWSWGWYGGGGGGGGTGGGGGGTGGGGGGTSTPVSRPPSGDSPATVSQAYGFNQITFPSGASSVAGNGQGQTIAIVDAYNDPNIGADLAHFDGQFGLAAPPSFKVVGQDGSAALPSTNASWAQETSLDVEWAHAMAPGANIVLVEASSSSLSDLLKAVGTAAHQSGVGVVSMSWGTGEFAGETAYDSTFNVPNVTFVASSGDSGGSEGADWPSASPNVVSVGGTTLTTTASGAYSSETAWSGSSSGSGGGVSSYETTPVFQQGTLPVSLPGRTTPDVSYNANPSTGFAVYDSLAYQGQAGWLQVGGTSAGAPQWAALVAIADQGRALNHAAPLSSASTLGTLYGLGGTLYQQTPSPVFHDVTSGHNAYNSAGPGFDAVTGLGSPIANALVASLVGQAAPAAIATATTHAAATHGSIAAKVTQPHIVAPASPTTSVLVGVSTGPAGTVLTPAITTIAMPLPATTTLAAPASTSVSNDASVPLPRGQSVERPRGPDVVRIFLRETRSGVANANGAPQHRRGGAGPNGPLGDGLSPVERNAAAAVPAAPAAGQPAAPADPAPEDGALMAPVSAPLPIADLGADPVREGALGGVAIAFGLAWIGRAEKKDPLRRRSVWLPRSFEDLQRRS